MITWTLSTDKTKLRWRGRRVFGRADFPNHKSLSREHFELFEENGELFVQDLGSTNGTRIARGAEVIALEANKPECITEEDGILVGSAAFAVVRAQDSWFTVSSVFRDSLILVGLIGACFIEPSYHFGLALDFVSLLIVLTVLLLSFAISVFIFRGVFYFAKMQNEGAQKIGYGVSVVVLSLVLNHFLMVLFHFQYGALSTIIQSKIEYFCLTNYNHNQCVRQVNLCPPCAIKLDRWKRDKIVNELKKMRLNYSSEAKKQLGEMRAPASPSTEKELSK